MNSITIIVHLHFYLYMWCWPFGWPHDRSRPNYILAQNTFTINCALLMQLCYDFLFDTLITFNFICINGPVNVKQARSCWEIYDFWFQEPLESHTDYVVNFGHLVLLWITIPEKVDLTCSRTGSFGTNVEPSQSTNVI